MQAKYAGLSYEQMSRLALGLLTSAVNSGNWHAVMDDLTHLKREMKMKEQGGHFIYNRQIVPPM